MTFDYIGYWIRILKISLTCQNVRSECVFITTKNISLLNFKETFPLHDLLFYINIYIISK